MANKTKKEENEEKVEEVVETEQKENTDEKYLEQLQRTLAEFDNYKKRVAKEKEELYNIMTGDIMSKFLPIVDNMENAIKALEGKDENIIQGIILILKQFQDVLKSFGIEEIETKGATFNPELHEAVIHIEDEQFGEGEIIEELRKGYICKDRVLRYSMVKVAN